MPPLTIPEGLDLLTTPDGVAIRRRWFTWVVVPLIFFVIFWDGFLVSWYSIAFSKHHPPLMMILFPLVHVGIGVGLTYYVVATFFNKTDILVSPSRVQVITGPLPWFGNQIVAAANMTGVVVRTRTTGKGGRTFSVLYVDPARHEKTLVRGLPQIEQAEFIAGTIRTALSLKDEGPESLPASS